MATANLDLTTWGYYSNDNADAEACTELAQDATYDFQTGTANKFIVRLGMSEIGNANYTGDITLEYKLNDGSFLPVATDSSVLQATTGLPTDGAVCDVQLLANGTGDFDTDFGSYSEDGAATALATKNDYGEAAWCVYIVAADVSDNDTIYLRHTSGDNETYSVVPSFTVDKPAVSYVSPGMLYTYYQDTVIF